MNSISKNHSTRIATRQIAIITQEIEDIDLGWCFDELFIFTTPSREFEDIVRKIRSDIWQNYKVGHLMPEAVEEIYKEYGLYVEESHTGDILVRLYPTDSELLKKYPIQMLKKTRYKIIEMVKDSFEFENEEGQSRIRGIRFSKHFSDSIFANGEVLTTTDWINLQRRTIQEGISEMVKLMVIKTTLKCPLKEFDIYGKGFALDLGYELLDDQIYETNSCFDGYKVELVLR